MELFNKRLIKQAIEKSYFIIAEKDAHTRDIITKIQDFLIKDKNRTKEKSIQSLYLQRIFEEILGYPSQLSGLDEYNLIIEPTTDYDSTEPDGALGFFSEKGKAVKAVIELKPSGTDLDKKQTSRKDQKSPIEQGFGYSYKFDGCIWVIISNFNEIRLYNTLRGIEFYEQFNIFNLHEDEEFKKFYFLLCKKNLISKTESSVIELLTKETSINEENITKEFYKTYKDTRIKLFNHLTQNNPQIDKYIILEKVQKIIDRVIFISFCEDLGLLPYNIFRDILKTSEYSFDISETKIWNQVKGLFHSINQGNPNRDINKFNGGLFAKDTILDSLIIKDEVIKEIIRISDYDFESDLNVNILGHIFEQSISDIEEMKSEISDRTLEKKIGKRKKEGIYYTPEYITKYIVEQAVGGWLEDKKNELGFTYLPKLNEDDYSSIKITKKGKLKTNFKVEKHINFWESYREILSNIKVLDPACGSGAFLIQAFDYLYKEGQLVNDELAKLQRGQKQVFDLDKHILTNNIYGVDLNEESVQITKLSLWLKTANKEKELTALDDNIRCGNSLINDPVIAEKKAFNWNEEFKEILDTGGFDIIIGNPPYGANLTVEEKKYLTKKYNNVHLRTPDTFNYFISLSLRILKDNGFLSFIVPNNLFFQYEFLKTRNLLINNMQLLSAINLGDKIFSDSEVPTCIFVATKKDLKDYELKYADLRNLERKDENVLLEADKIIYTKSEILSNSSLTFGMNKFINKINSKIIENSFLIDTIALFVSYGISTGGNNIFCVNDHLINKFKLEKSLLFNVLAGEHINKYLINYREHKIIYTKKSIKIDDFPKIYDYLKQFKNTLSNRSEVRARILPWWCLNRPRSKSLFNEEKIILRQTGDSIKACLDDNNYFVLDSIMVIKLKKEYDIDLKYLLAILNSNLMNYIYKNISQEDKRSFAQVKPINIRKLPIKNTSKKYQLILVKKVDKIMNLKKSIIENRNKKLNFLINELSIRKITPNLENFYKLPWNSFIKEIEKQNNKISINKKEELFNWFNEKKTNFRTLNEELKNIEKEIDQEIYKLYNLSEEEVKIIESV